MIKKGKFYLDHHEDMSYLIVFVIPAFNEELCLPHLIREIEKNVPAGYAWQAIAVDDGSSDSTLKTLNELRKIYPHNVRYLSLSRNFGHQVALKAGLDHVSQQAECVITMDADMQHPPNMIPQLLQKWKEGAEIVLTQRTSTEEVTLPKKIFSRAFYQFLSFLSETKIRPGMADFKLLDRTVIDALKKVNENTLFLRGVIPWMGFKQVVVRYDAPARFAGKTKYSSIKMIRLAVNGILSSSLMPLRLATFVGAIFSLLAIIYLFYVLYIYFVKGTAISGWASILITMLCASGIQLLILGILGEYLGKVFLESRGRPYYFIRRSSLD